MELNKLNILDLIKDAEEIQSQWSGNEAGLTEERAMIAGDIITKCNQLIELINELS